MVYGKVGKTQVTLIRIGGVSEIDYRGILKNIYLHGIQIQSVEPFFFIFEVLELKLLHINHHNRHCIQIYFIGLYNKIFTFYRTTHTTYL